MHLAAGAGLRECVELLISYHADMVAINDEGLTPADLAKKNAYDNIATSLEAHMVYSVSRMLDRLLARRHSWSTPYIM